MSTLVQAKSKVKLQPASLVEEALSLYRNYFLERAISASNVSTAFYSLKGLKFLRNQLFLANTGDDYLVADGSVNSLKYDCKDAFGKPAKLKEIKKLTLVQLDPTGANQEEDATSSAKLERDGQSVLVTFDNIKDMKWTSYALRFELEAESAPGSVYVTKTFMLKTMIYKDAAVHFAQLEGWDAPTVYQYSDGYPVVFQQLNTNDFSVLHVQLDTQFSGDRDKVDYPLSVFITL